MLGDGVVILSGVLDDLNWTKSCVCVWGGDRGEAWGWNTWDIQRNNIEVGSSKTTNSPVRLWSFLALWNIWSAMDSGIKKKMDFHFWKLRLGTFRGNLRDKQHIKDLGKHIWWLVYQSKRIWRPGLGWQQQQWQKALGFSEWSERLLPDVNCYCILLHLRTTITTEMNVARRRWCAAGVCFLRTRMHGLSYWVVVKKTEELSKMRRRPDEPDEDFVSHLLAIGYG